VEIDEQSDKNFNPNWQFVGKLKDVSVFNINDKSFFWVKTNTTAFTAEAVLTEPLHFGQTVKFSKRDKSVKIGNQFLQRVE
jgi:hypothetical protein